MVEHVPILADFMLNIKDTTQKVGFPDDHAELFVCSTLRSPKHG
jgi:hypothetical protein